MFKSLILMKWDSILKMPRSTVRKKSLEGKSLPTSKRSQIKKSPRAVSGSNMQSANAKYFGLSKKKSDHLKMISVI